MANAKELSWNIRQNTINLTTTLVDDKNKAYLVDKRLLDNLLSRITNGTFDSIKLDIKQQIDIAKDKVDLFKRLDEYIYMDTIVNKLVELEPKVELSVGEAIDAVANGVSAKEYQENQAKTDEYARDWSKHNQ